MKPGLARRKARPIPPIIALMILALRHATRRDLLMGGVPQSYLDPFCGSVSARKSVEFQQPPNV